MCGFGWLGANINDIIHTHVLVMIFGYYLYKLRTDMICICARVCGKCRYLYHTKYTHIDLHSSYILFYFKYTHIDLWTWMGSGHISMGEFLLALGYLFDFP